MSKDRAIEFFTVSGISIVLSIIIFESFNATKNYSISVLLITVIISLILNLISFCLISKVPILIGIMTFIFVVILLISNFLLRSNIFIDSENNKLFFLIIVFFTNLLCFIATRVRLTSILFCTIGIFISVAIEFLYKPHNYLLIILLIIFSALLISISLKFLIPVFLIGIIGLGISALVFFAVIKPLNPKANELKLITIKMAVPIIEKTGIGTVFEEENETKKTNTNDNKEDVKKDSSNNNASKNKLDNNNNTSEKNNKSLFSNIKDGFFIVIKYFIEHLSLMFLLIFVILAVLISSIFLKKYLRKRWFNDISKKPKDIQIKDFYKFYLKRIKKLKKKIIKGETLIEFGKRMDRELSNFNTSSAKFSELSQMYSNLIYGEKIPNDTAMKKFINYYDSFYKNLKQTVGGFKYAKLFYFI